MKRCRHGLRGLLGVLWLGLCALLPGAGLAQETDTGPVWEVELIIFRHLDRTGTTAETPRPDTSSRTPAPALPAVSFFLMDPRSVAPEVSGLAADRLQLTGIYARLERLGAYQPLLHLGWEQPALPRRQAAPFRLSAATGSTTGLAGAITLYQERFLHLAVDLRADAPPGAADLDRPRLLASRRVRDDSLQYFDHPEFGVIASVRRAPAPVAEGISLAR